MSGVFDSFFLLFKSNASDARKDIEKTDKAATDLENKFKESEKTLGKVSDNLLKIAVEGIAAFTTFEGIKNGTLEAISYNAQLQKSHQLTGENARQLAIYDDAFSSLGAKEGEFINWFTQYSQYLQSIGRDTKTIIPDILKLSEILKGMDEQQARMTFQLANKEFGLPQSFLPVLMGMNGSLSEAVEKMGKLEESTDGSAEAGLRLESAFKSLKIESRGFFTSSMEGMGDFLGAIGLVIKGLRIIFDLFTFRGWADLKTMYKRDFEGADPNAKEKFDYMSLGGWKEFFGGKKKEPQVDTSNGITISGNAPVEHLLDEKSVKDITDNPEAMKILTRAIGKKSESGDLSRAKEHLDFADKSPINLVTQTLPVKDKTPSLTIGSMVVNTQASDPRAVADAISNKLKEEYRNTMSNYDDGVSK